MDRRIEIAIPVDNPNVKNRLVNEILQTCWMDDAKARILQADGSYVRRQPSPGKQPLRAQQRFIDIAREGGIQSMPYEIAIRHKPKLKGERPIMKKKEKKEKDKDRERDREKRPDANVALMASAAVAAAAAAANPPAAALPALPPAATPAPLVGGTSAAPQRPSPATPSERLLSAVVENGPDGSDEGS
jgi:hypothetical protein